MLVTAITLCNFKSFKAEQTFRIPQQPGLYFMQGVNESEPRLEANGAGKSTLWDALTWCLFGKTSRGLKAGDVCTWEAGKGARVCIQFETHGSEGTVTHAMARTWSPNSWTLRNDFDPTVTDLAKDENNAVLALLRLEFTPFLNCILMAQGQPMFLDQKADAKAALFSDVMGLDKWLESSARASKAASAQDTLNRGLESRIAGLLGRVETLEGGNLDLSIMQWENDRWRRGADVEKEYDVILAEVKAAKAELRNAEDNVAESLPILAIAQDRINALTARMSDSKNHLNYIRSAFSVTDSDLKRDKEWVARLQKDGDCPTCGKSLRTSEHSALVRESNRSVKASAEAHQETQQQLDLALSQCAACEHELEDAADAYKQSARTYTEALTDLDGIKQKIQRGGISLDRLEARLESIAKEVSPFTRLEADRKEKLAALQAASREAQAQFDDGSYHHSILSFWVRGFKDLRLQLIAEALTELEVEANSCVEALGLLDWELKFEVDRETKSGTIQRGFSVFVRSPHNTVAVPWEAWSGGEAQRLRLAATMGLANLIRSRSGTTFDVEVWDEPSQGLSGQGVQDLLEALATRGRVERRRVWIVDHTAHSFGDFAGGAVITKTGKGSVVTQY